MRVNNTSTVETDEPEKARIVRWPNGLDCRFSKLILPMNDSLQEVVNLFSLKDLLDIIFLLDCSVMQPLRFPHDDQNPISFRIKVL